MMRQPSTQYENDKKNQSRKGKLDERIDRRRE